MNTQDAVDPEMGTYAPIGAPLPDWMADGLCAQTDPDAFFPSKGQPNWQAKKICALCPVQQECLDYALAVPEMWGVWGGTGQHERRQMIKRAAS